MKLIMQREALLQPLSKVVGVVERRQTIPVLANFLLQAEDGVLSCTGTDMEMVLRATQNAEVVSDGSVTAPARKLVDICRALPDGCSLTISVNDDQLRIDTGKSHFSLSTLPVDEYPDMEKAEELQNFTVVEKHLHELLNGVAFAMANQDVRYYLNGLLLEIHEQRLRAVATDGHRLALADHNDLQAESDVPAKTDEDKRVIVPRKAVMELLRLLEDSDERITIGFGRNHMQVQMPGLIMTSKLIDGRFPEYQAVIPPANDHQVKVDKQTLRTALHRAAILSNEKFRGVRLEFTPGKIRIIAHNPQHEEAVEDIDAEHQIDSLSIGFNVTYLMDALAVIKTSDVLLLLRDANSSCLIREPDSDETQHVIMPLKL
jgi:DNA polymerase-3 subunit beta